MNKWPNAVLGDLVTFSRERAEPKDAPETRFNYIGLETIEGHSGHLLPYEPTLGYEIRSTKNVFHPGEILYGKLRPNLNKVHLAETSGVCSTDIFVLHTSDRVDAAYIAHYLRSPAVLSIASSRMAGVNLPRVKQETLAEILVPVPPLAEQERLVKILDEADALRKLRAQADRRTAELTPALFHEMFGENSHHEMLPLGKLVQEFRYGTSNKSASEGRPTLRIPNVVGQAVNIDDLKFVPVSDSEFRRLQLVDGDLLFVRTNGNPDYVGRSAVFEYKAVTNRGFNPSNFIYASYLIRARLLTEKVLPIFVQSFLASGDGLRAIRMRCKTSAGQFNINTEGLGTIPIPVFPLSQQQKFVQRVREIREMEATQAQSRAGLDALFASLLDRAFKRQL
jgi:type I restriction enzyme, S subunit